MKSNSETDEDKLNLYLKFVLILYQNCNEYFYSSDVKVLIDILLREIEMNISGCSTLMQNSTNISS